MKCNSTLRIEGALGSDGHPLERVEDDESVSGADGHQAPLGGEPDRVDAGRRGHLDQGGRTPHTTALDDLSRRLPLERGVALPRETLL